MSEPTCSYVSSQNKCRYFVKVWLMVLAVLFCTADAWAQSAAIGALRVRIIDQDWDVPLAGATVQVLEVNQKCMSGEDGNVLFDSLPGGSYTLVISAPGFERRVMAQVVVVPGEARSEEVRLIGAFTDMDEFVVKDIELMSGGGEIVQLEIRSKSSGMIDNIGSDMMSKAGVGTAAAAMRMVTGANVQDGKYAVIRGLGDRYTATLLNGVRLPTSDKDKRAVQLDQFPSAMIESIQVTKTFTPDQQGDASGGGINIVTKSVPERTILSASVSTEYDSNTTGNKDFKTVTGGGNDFGGMRGMKNFPFWSPGKMEAPRGLSTEQRSSVITGEASPANSGFKFAVGDSIQAGDWKFGSLLNGSYSQKYKYRKGEKNVLSKDPDPTEFILLDSSKMKTVETSTDEQLWSTGLTLGAKNENNELKFTTIYTHMAREVVDLRYDPLSAPDVSLPDRRNNNNVTTTRSREFSTLSQYTENNNGSVQLAGKHVIEPLNRLELDWTGAYNASESTEPDRQTFSGANGDGFTSVENSALTDRRGNPYVNTSTIKGDLSRRWQDIREESRQVQANAKQPFTLLENDGYFKTGIFADRLDRIYRNREYTLRVDGGALNEYDFTQFPTGQPVASDAIPNNNSTDYNGRQEITAYYGMLRAPLPEWMDLIGGARVEETLMNTKVWSAVPGMNGHIFVTSLVPNDDGILSIKRGEQITEADAAASINQMDVLPAVALNFKKIEDVSIRFAYSQTIARPTFKELTPVEYSDVDPSLLFVGNQKLKMSSLKNYDARVEWRPGGHADMLAASIFYKSIIDPIQNTTYGDTQPGSDKRFLFPENYKDAWVKGVEFEARKSLGFICESAKDLSVGSNLTIQDSFVEYTDSLKQLLNRVDVSSDGRVMDGQPNYLANVNLLYQNETSGFMAGLFYNLRGESYTAGEASTGKIYTPHIVEMPLATLDFTLGFKFAKNWRVGFDVKNLLDPMVESVYRRPNGDLPNASYKHGRTVGLSLGYEW